MAATDYSKRTTLKQAFTNNVFKLFTDVCGGDPKEFANELYSKFTVEDFAYGDDMYYWGVIEYFNLTVIPHKIEVYKAGMEFFNIPQLQHFFNESTKQEFIKNLWLHDLSKFSANEAFGYACYNRKTGSGKTGFERSWHHHKMNNPHHPEYWLNPNRSGELEPISMPKIYILEMIADWIGAGKTYGSTLEEWLPENIDKFKFANQREVAEMILMATGIDINSYKK